MKTNVKVIFVTLMYSLCFINLMKAQNWLTAGNTLTGTLPSSPNEWIGSSNAADWIIKTNNAERLRVSSTGNVGIGVANPLGLLNLGAASGVGVNIYVQSNGGGPTHGLWFGNQLSTSGSGKYAGLKVDITNDKFYIMDYSVTAGTAVERMTFDINGNVGIGTTIPLTVLQIIGSSQAGGGVNGTSGDGIFRISTGTGISTNNALFFGVHDGDYSWIQASQPGTNYRNLALNPNGGNVGIGTVSPGAKLEIAGQVKITGGSPGSGKILASDVNGLASWSTVDANGGWSTTGNSGTVDGTNFIGTTDNVPFNIRVNNQMAGRIDQTLANTFFGYTAGNITISGFSNSGYGYQALNANTTGYDNTACGSAVLKSNTTGISNTAFGSKAMSWNTTGLANAAFGLEALTNNTTGGYNTASGLQALQNNTTGSYNTSNGNQALRNITTGSTNTALGYQAGYDGTTHSQCTFIGANATLTTNRTNVTLLGYGIVDAQCTNNNQVCIGNTSIGAGGLRAAVTGWTAYSDSRFKTNVKENVAGLAFILKLKPVTYNVAPRELHKIWGTPDSVVNKMDFSETEKEVRIGFIAQDVEKAARESGFSFPGIDVPKNSKEVYTLRYVDFIMPMIKGIQEQQTMIDSLKTDNSTMKKHMNQQDSTIAILKKQMEQFSSVLPINNNSITPSALSVKVELSNKNVVILNQNIPNPFAEETSISYYLPDNVIRAQIVFFDQSGNLIKAVDLTEKGKGTLNVFADDLSNGIYTYSIIVDGQRIETKKMVKAK